jgi:hypothetical protein
MGKRFSGSPLPYATFTDWWAGVETCRGLALGVGWVGRLAGESYGVG